MYKYLIVIALLLLGIMSTTGGCGCGGSTSTDSATTTTTPGGTTTTSPGGTTTTSPGGTTTTSGGGGGETTTTTSTTTTTIPDLMGWAKATDAPFPARFGHTCLVYDSKLWVIAGGKGNSIDDTMNDVWWSANGTDWTQATAAAAFPKRFKHSSVVFNGKMWVIGGDDGLHTGLNDVWWSTNGADWTQATAAAAFSTRFSHTSVVFNDGGGEKMWVIAGYDQTPSKSDVWSSTDGATWNQATSAAGFAARFKHSSVVANGAIWVIGGAGATDDAMGDVWSSSDGASWTRATAAVPFTARFSHASVVTDGNKLWVIGGANNQSPLTIFNDIWNSTDGNTWTMATGRANFSKRDKLAAVLFNGKLWVIGGDTSRSAPNNEVWSATP